MRIRAAIPPVIAHGSTVTTRQIAQAAGIGEGTIFRVFADKVPASAVASGDRHEQPQHLIPVPRPVHREPAKTGHGRRPARIHRLLVSERGAQPSSASPRTSSPGFSIARSSCGTSSAGPYACLSPAQSTPSHCSVMGATLRRHAGRPHGRPDQVCAMSTKRE
ncbi:hypothetical protein [Streptomyces sp. NPDC001970]